VRARLRERAREAVDLEWRTLREAIARAAPAASGRLLDVGCGDKPWEAALRPYVTEHLGVEYAPTAQDSVALAAGRADVVYSSDELPFEPASFDTVLCTQVLEHVPDPGALMADMARVLRPGGALIVTVPFAFRIHYEPHDFWRFTSYALAELAARAGLTVERLEARGGSWLVVGHKLTTWLAFGVARLDAEAQRAGGRGYEAPAATRPRLWTLPAVAPALLAVAAAARAADRRSRDRHDTLGYLLVARKPA